MPEGVIVGGWPSVIAAYGITAVGLGFYVWSLLYRNRGVSRPADHRASRGGALPAVPPEEDVNDD